MRVSGATNKAYALAGHRPASIGQHDVNVGPDERTISTIAGAGFFLKGLLGSSRMDALWILLGGGLLYRGLTGYCPAYGALQGLSGLAQECRAGLSAGAGVKAEQSVIIHRPRGEVFEFWRNLKNLPDLFEAITAVESTGNGPSHWEVRTPAGNTLDWEAEIIQERDGELIAWQSLPHADIRTAGSVHFDDAGDQQTTRVTVSLRYDPAGGKLTDAAASLLNQDIASQVRDALGVLKEKLDGPRREPQGMPDAPQPPQFPIGRP